MADDSVIDANCWGQFVEEKLQSADGLAIAVFRIAQSLGAVLFDDGLLIKQQYLDVRRGPGAALFDDFFERGVLAGSVRLVPAAADGDLGRTLKALGVPRKEYVYFRTAASGGARHVVSEDIDFFDPSMKKHPERKKTTVKRDRSGCVCREFRRGYGIEIYCMTGFVHDLEPGEENQPA